MKRQIIFVSGVHGVGKTTLCKKIASRYKIEHFSASNLIAKEKAEEHLQNKQVENITGNQDFLVTAINKYFKNETWYLLDGHFCLLNKNNEITKIPYSTYEGICPRAIILLVDEPENIYTRLNSRDSIKHDLSLLRSFQEQERRRQYLLHRHSGCYQQEARGVGWQDCFRRVDHDEYGLLG